MSAFATMAAAGDDGNDNCQKTESGAHRTVAETSRLSRLVRVAVMKMLLRLWLQ
jgi:hypothetical protein